MSQFSADAAPFVPPTMPSFAPNVEAAPFVPGSASQQTDGTTDASGGDAYAMWVQQLLHAGHSMADIERFGMPGAAAPYGRGGRGGGGRGGIRGRGRDDASALLPGGYAERRKRAPRPTKMRTMDDEMGWAPMVRPEGGPPLPPRDGSEPKNFPPREPTDEDIRGGRRRGGGGGAAGGGGRGGGAGPSSTAAWSPEQMMLALHKEAQDFEEPDLPVVQTPNGPRMALGLGEPPEKYTAIVQYKRGRLRQYECTSSIRCGEYGIIESSSGIDCGLVVMLARYSWDGSIHVEELEGSDAMSCKLPLEAGAVRRVATERETELILTYVPRIEQQALNLFRLRCRAHGQNPGIIEDCELQFDGRRLTFFYDSDIEHDFRDVVREIAMAYNARVWVDNINPAAASRPLTTHSGGGGGGGGAPKGEKRSHQPPPPPPPPMGRPPAFDDVPTLPPA